MKRKHHSPGVSRRNVLTAGLGLGAATLGFAPTVRAATLAPTVSGPLLDTRGKGVLVWDVEGLDYVAEEYFLSGRANVYVPVSMADAPDVASRDSAKDLGARNFSRELVRDGDVYTTRLVVYRPKNARRFSGNAIVETLHPSGGGRGVVWGALHGFFAAHGDAYIGVQHPLTIPGLKLADASRYAGLGATDPTQLWGMLIQTGQILKAAGRDSPLKGYSLKRVLMTGYSYTGVATATFANYHHGEAKLADGRNIFDAYLPMGDAQYVRPLNVPVMRLNTQSDFNSFGGLTNRRPDDAKYRHYEIPGASHVAVPPPDDAAKAPPPGQVPTPAGQPQFSPSSCQASFPAGSLPDDFPLYLAQQALFENMYRWLELGLAPPPSAYIATNPDGSTQLDEFGNALGGVRYPPVSVPIARYGVGSTPSCLLFGFTAPFDATKRRTLYGDHAGYVAKVQADAQALADKRLLRSADVASFVAIARASEAF